MDSSANGRWIIPYKKFCRLSVKIHFNKQIWTGASQIFKQKTTTTTKDS